MANTLLAGNNINKLYQLSGMVSTTTIKTSQSTTTWTTAPIGISYDGTNTKFNSPAKYYNLSGLFSSTLKTSGADVTGGSTQDIDADGTDTPSVYETGSVDKLVLVSGVFTTTVKTSLNINALDSVPTGNSFDGTDTLWCGNTNDKLFIQSGQFNSTVKASLSVSAIEATVQGIGWNGTDAPWCGESGDKVYLQSGQITSTMKTSIATSGFETRPASVETDDFNARLGIGAATASLLLMQRSFRQ